MTEGYAVSRTLGGILEDLESVTAAYSAPRPGENSRSLYEKDLAASVDALTRLINYNAASRTRPLSNKHDISNLVKTSSNLLELSNLPAWKTALKVIFKFKSLNNINKESGKVPTKPFWNYLFLKDLVPISPSLN